MFSVLTCCCYESQVMGYESVPDAEHTAKTFENKSVIIFGMGNAGFETARNPQASSHGPPES